MSQALSNGPKGKVNEVSSRSSGRHSTPRLPQQNDSSKADDDDILAKDLIARIKKGNQQAFAELVSRYNRQVAALAFKMVGNYDEAADVTQIVFVKMYDNVWRFDPKKKFYSWLYRITVNASIDYMRKHKRHRHEPLEDFHERSDDTTTDPESSYRRHQVGLFVKQATRSLSDKQRSAFVLRDSEGCDIDEVASPMHVSEATVRWYLHRARTKIRKELRRECPQVLRFLGIF